MLNKLYLVIERMKGHRGWVGNQYYLLQKKYCNLDHRISEYKTVKVLDNYYLFTILSAAEGKSLGIPKLAKGIFKNLFS